MRYRLAHDIKVILESVNGRHGWFWMSHGAAATAWDQHGDDPLLRAELEHFDDDSGRMVDYRLTPEEWAYVIANDGANDLLRWTSNGLSLRGAVVAALNDIDADALMRGEDTALTTAMERVVDLRAAAAMVCLALSKEPVGTRERCHLAELQAALGSQN